MSCEDVCVDSVSPAVTDHVEGRPKSRHNVLAQAAAADCEKSIYHICQHCYNMSYGGLPCVGLPYCRKNLLLTYVFPIRKILHRD